SPRGGPADGARFALCARAGARLLCKKLLLEGEGREPPATVRGDEDLLLELDPFRAAIRADIALDRQGHSSLEDAIIAAGLPILRISNHRPFIRHTDAVSRRGITVLDELSRQLPSPIRELTKRHARANELEIVLDVLMGEAIKPSLLGAWP